MFLAIQQSVGCIYLTSIKKIGATLVWIQLRIATKIKQDKQTICAQAHVSLRRNNYNLKRK